MRAALLNDWRSELQIENVATPECPQDGVVLNVLACGICRSDWHAWTGSDGPLPFPHILGHEYCGVVEEIGSRVTKWKKGDRVIAPFILACGHCNSCAAGNQTTCDEQILPGFNAPGAFAEYVAVPHAETNLTALPESMDEALAASLGCRATTAWHGLTGRAALQGGEWLAIYGGGGVGVAALLLGKALGARVVVVDVVQDKLDYATKHGADAVVDASKTDPVEAIREITSGGAHVSLEALGFPETTVNSIKSLRKLGRHIQIGMPAGDHLNMEIPMDAVYSGQLALYGTRGMPAWRYPSLLSLIEGGSVDLSPMIARKVALSNITEELQAFDKPAPPGVAVITDFQG